MKSNKSIEEYGDVIDVRALCEILNIGRNTAYRLLKENEIEFFKIGKSIKIPTLCVKKYINKQVSF